MDRATNTTTCDINSILIANIFLYQISYILVLLCLAQSLISMKLRSCTHPNKHGGWNLSYMPVIYVTPECNRCRNIQCNVITTYYPYPNPNHKKSITRRSQNIDLNPNILTCRKKWQIVALGLGLGFLEYAAA